MFNVTMDGLTKCISPEHCCHAQRRLCSWEFWKVCGIGDIAGYGDNLVVPDIQIQ